MIDTLIKVTPLVEALGVSQPGIQGYIKSGLCGPVVALGKRRKWYLNYENVLRLLLTNELFINGCIRQQVKSVLAEFQARLENQGEGLFEQTLTVSRRKLRDASEAMEMRWVRGGGSSVPAGFNSAVTIPLNDLYTKAMALLETYGETRDLSEEVA